VGQDIEQRIAKLVAQRAGPALLLEQGQRVVRHAQQPLRLIDGNRDPDRIEEDRRPGSGWRESLFRRGMRRADE
jgi:hypothetical protein